MKAAPFFQNICASINLGILIIDADYRLAFINDWFKKHSSLDIEKCLGQPFLQLFPEVHDTRLLTAITECLINAIPSYLSTVFHTSPLHLFRHHQKQTKLMQQDISVLPIEDDGTRYCLLQINDVSTRSNREAALQEEIRRREEAEESLQASRATLQSVLDNSPLLISMRDLESNIILVNRQHDLLSDNDKLQTNPPFSNILAADTLRNGFRPQEFEQTIKHRDGSSHIYHTVTFPIMEEGKTTSIGTIALDISERKESEHQRRLLTRQLQQAQKMESIGHLTGGIAHDFNNILTSVLGYTQLSAECLKNGRVEKLDNYLKEVESAAEKAQKLVQQMLAFSRGQTISTEQVDVQKVLSDTLSLLRPTLPTSIALRAQFEGDETLRIEAHPVQLSQAILNLALNARDAMQGKGVIGIELLQRETHDELCASCHKPISGHYLHIHIYDNGPGIEPQQLEKIFEPFYTTKELGRGSGMGLSMVHGIIHNFGGHIKVSSTPHKKTSFHILLPLLTPLAEHSAQSG